MEVLRTVVSGVAVLFFGAVLILQEDKFAAVSTIAFAYIWFMVVRAYERRFDPVSSVAKVVWIFAPYLAFALQLAILFIFFGAEPAPQGGVSLIIWLVVFLFPFLLIVLDVLLSKLL